MNVYDFGRTYLKQGGTDLAKRTINSFIGI